MSEETKPTPDAAPPASEAGAVPDAEREAKIAAAKAKAAAAKAAREAAAAAPPEGESAAPVAPAKAPAKAAAKAPAKAAAAKKEAAPAYAEIKDDAFIASLRAAFQDDIKEAVTSNGQQILRVVPERARDLLWYLRYDASIKFDMLTDVTAVHYPDRKAFEVVYQLYSIAENRRLRVKAELPEDQPIYTVCDIWAAANWLEREVYDMFGICFEGHPDLRRILLPEGWVGFPLRKEYPVEYRHNEWVAENLNILEIPEGADLTGKFE
ncbi:NADH-quinone oxidoreductase subunit C [Chloracidobacterium thermophilum]|jgi:NADH-quinone oxidoreductase subunit C|uniref:NADH-quinone oxidoreductase subunit C n=1 Tax=Chloracidobacterium thermophilum (strain B) TaxID=981222 RepID=G2LJ15_CHLTF|nr:NADH-quinone oxidoreductase subunit C [Chloracidobacterium thermophilum]AEP12783.1 NADH (or F420H2) dehydrogenase, subunit C [Chloracidobacterium thermophilum B]QUV78513.1 NADH-quinone oxidoreductase subunit C [Chloracidobacterium thermophilum]